MQFLATIHVTLKASVLDPQGTTVARSLQALGYDEVDDVRVGKYIELRLTAESMAAAEERVAEMCDRLLANPVIENYRFELIQAAATEMGGEA